jgi:hypothetical protein
MCPPAPLAAQREGTGAGKAAASRQRSSSPAELEVVGKGGIRSNKGARGAKHLHGRQPPLPPQLLLPLLLLPPPPPPPPPPAVVAHPTSTHALSPRAQTAVSRTQVTKL